jgi:hypothetical protein
MADTKPPRPLRSISDIVAQLREMPPAQQARLIGLLPSERAAVIDKVAKAVRDVTLRYIETADPKTMERVTKNAEKLMREGFAAPSRIRQAQLVQKLVEPARPPANDDNFEPLVKAADQLPAKKVFVYKPLLSPSDNFRAYIASLPPEEEAQIRAGKVPFRRLITRYQGKGHPGAYSTLRDVLVEKFGRRPTSAKGRRHKPKPKP